LECNFSLDINLGPNSCNVVVIFNEMYISFISIKMMFYLYNLLILPFNKINGIVVTGSKSSNHTSDRDIWDLFGGGGGRLQFSLICGRPV